MSSNCGKCNGKLTAKSKMIKCNICDTDYHHNCVNINEKLLVDHHSGNSIWLCDKCKSKLILDETEKIACNVDCDDHMPSMAAVYKVVKEILEQQKSLNTSFIKFQEDMAKINNKVTLNEENIKLNMEKNADNSNKIRLVEEENLNLKVKLNDAEKVLNLNSLEITGIPEPNGKENLLVTIRMLAMALGHNTFDTSMLDNYYRLRQPNNKSKIILKFVRKSDRDDFLQCRKIKRDFSTAMLDKSLSSLVKQHNIIYINEILTQENKKLLKLSKEYKKKHNIKFLWIKNGNIYMRRSEDSQVVVIKNENNLTEL